MSVLCTGSRPPPVSHFHKRSHSIPHMHLLVTPISLQPAVVWNVWCFPNSHADHHIHTQFRLTTVPSSQHRRFLIYHT